MKSPTGSPSALFESESAVAQRQPKTDRLILSRFLNEAAADKRLDARELADAHAVLVKWADLESSGRLHCWHFGTSPVQPTFAH